MTEWRKHGFSVPAITWVPLLFLILSIFVLLLLKRTLSKKSGYKKNKLLIFWMLFCGFNFIIFLLDVIINGSGIFGFGNLLILLSFCFLVVFLSFRKK
ncbi:MAG: hypothetical protein MRECE_7c043 [Mycoplasmataceae bacterium CE_OT135]|nr:MAG: hypothetical protein MRECE_7c043 [Mycoplasmataceae bacterium CE_OT135]